MRRHLMVVGFAMLTACKGPAGGQAAIGESDATKIAAEAEASFTSGNAKTIMDHYAPDAVQFDPGVNAPSRDRAQLTKWTEALVAMQPRNFNPGKRMIQPLGPDAFISSGLGSIDVQTGQGLQTVHLRYTDVFKKQPDGRWLIVHEHNSALPIPQAVPAQ